jgi:hypothetical protein
MGQDDNIQNTIENPIEKLELQLHEQYAINNNANLSSVIGLITATIVVVGFYGYLYVRSSLEYSNNFILYKDGIYTMDALLLIASATTVILAILQYICMYQGSHQKIRNTASHCIV